MPNKITVDRRLYLTADGDRLVEHGDPDAAFLWAIEGREVDADEADELGYSPSGTKAASEPENKAVEAPEDDKSNGTCAGTTADGEPCSKKAGEDGYCHLHSE